MADAGSIHYVDALILSLQRDPSDAKRRMEQLTRMRGFLPGPCEKMWPSVATAYTFGQDFAALVACGSFVDCLLQQGVAAELRRQGRGLETVPWELKKLIDLAVALGVVTAADGPLLQTFRELVRNKFAHGDASGIADSLYDVRGAWELPPGEELREWSADEVDQLRDATLSGRFDDAVKRYARSVIPWVSQWARRTCERLWPKPKEESDE
ncbi:MAG TPA: hypothetical protein VD866_06335 [Urbifossiella sp.]|nr:hypothetical protein [Urbifossiella sp.]